LEPLEERVLLASTELVCKNLGGGPSNGYSDYSAISANGRYVAFSSSASNLVTGDTNGVTDIFVLDTGAVWIGDLTPLMMSRLAQKSSQFSEFDIFEDLTLVLANDIKASRLAGVTL
jgi:hypothetical protein